jgi:hypothetical protein
MKVSIKRCARCGGDHLSLIFTPLSNPPHEFTHWAMCPVSKEPILMKSIPDTPPTPYDPDTYRDLNGP